MALHAELRFTEVTESDILNAGTWLQFGVRPYRIDILNTLSGVDTDEGGRAGSASCSMVFPSLPLIASL
jgi:hypothetical protein